MSLTIHRADFFWADLLKQVDWYRDKAGPEVAEAYIDSVEATLQELSKMPGLGRSRFRHRPELAGVRSWRVRKPYHRHLIFYRFDEDILMAERILHGARDLALRLLESPYESAD